jgi:phage-related protein
MSRPKKVVTDATPKEKRQYTKKVKTEQESSKSIETLEQQVEQLTELLTGSIEAQLEYHQVATDAEQKFKALAKETERCLNMIVYHCGEVQKNTGSLTSEDVEYSVSLIKRVIENKFKKD